MSTVFSVTSHEPFQVPAKFKGKFPMGKVQMHQVVGYTDYALKSSLNLRQKSRGIRILFLF